MHILLLISVILVSVSSFLFSVCAENKKFYINCCYFWGILFAQVVLGFEILSIPKALIPLNFLIYNIIIFALSVMIFSRKRPEILIFEDFKSDVLKIKKVLSHDNWLKACCIAFFIFLAGTLIYTVFMPVHDEDAFSYHLARVPFWIINQTVNHFFISDIRAVIMPINSEIIYAWAFLFIKSDIFVRLFSLCSYILFAVGLRGLFLELKIPVKVFLWIFFIITTMPGIMFLVAGSESNIAIAALIISAIYLFLYAVKRGTKIHIFFASLLYALAVGTKTPAILAAASILFISGTISYIYRKKDFYKPIILCGAFLVLNFIIFGSYNYVLNYIDFGNPFSSVYAKENHAFYGGFKAFIANTIRYTFDMLDFSQLPQNTKIWRIETALSKIVIALLGIDPDTGVLIDEKSLLKIGHNFENLIGAGILGIVLFIPSVFLCLKNKKYKSPRTVIINAFGIGFLINFIILSVSIGYMIYSIRFLVFFVMLASPALIKIINFKKHKIIKIITGCFIIYSLTLYYYFYEHRFTPYLLHIYQKYPKIQDFKRHIKRANIDWWEISQASKIVDTISKQENTNVLFFVSSGANIYTLVTEQGKYKADFMSLETAEEDKIDWDKYDYIVVPLRQLISNIQDPDKYKKAVKTFYVDGKFIYDYPQELFANCYYLDRTQDMFDWVNADNKRLSKADCYHKREIFEKHGFKFIEKSDNYEHVPEGEVYIYKKIR